jgi:hypothetical protein
MWCDFFMYCNIYSLEEDESDSLESGVADDAAPHGAKTQDDAINGELNSEAITDDLQPLIELQLSVGLASMTKG